MKHKKMTYIQFLKAVAKLSKFQETPYGIRSTKLDSHGNTVCPLKVMFGYDYYTLGAKAGLTWLNMTMIMNAADSSSHYASDSYPELPRARRLMEKYLLGGYA